MKLYSSNKYLTGRLGKNKYLEVGGYIKSVFANGHNQVNYPVTRLLLNVFPGLK